MMDNIMGFFSGPRRWTPLPCCPQATSLLALFCISVASGCAGIPHSYVRQHPELSSRGPGYVTVAIVPASTDFQVGQQSSSTCMGMGIEKNFSIHCDRLDDRSARIGRDLDSLLLEQVAARGFEARILDESEYYPKEAEHLIWAIWDGMYSQGMYDSKEPQVVAYSLGQDLQPIADAAASDLIVFTRFAGWKRSAGDVASEYLVKAITMSPGDATGGGVLFLALLDSRSGDFLWGNMLQDTSFSPNPPDFGRGRLDRMVKELLSPLSLGRQ